MWGLLFVPPRDYLGKVDMSEQLPVLLVREQQKYLFECMQEFPHILDVFQNIYCGRPLNHEIHIKNMKTLDMFIETLFVPILLQYEAVVKDESAPNKLRPLVSGIRTAEGKLSDKEVGKVALRGMDDIVHSISPEDSAENVLTAYIHGEYSQEYCSELLKGLRSQANDALIRPASDSSDGSNKKMRLSIAMKYEK